MNLPSFILQFYNINYYDTVKNIVTDLLRFVNRLVNRLVNQIQPYIISMKARGKKPRANLFYGGKHEGRKKMCPMRHGASGGGADLVRG